MVELDNMDTTESSNLLDRIRNTSENMFYQHQGLIEKYSDLIDKHKELIQENMS